jgi:hypothetical protein
MASHGDRVITLDEEPGADLESVPVVARLLCEPDAPDAVVTAAPVAARAIRRARDWLPALLDWMGYRALCLALRRRLPRRLVSLKGFRRGAVREYYPRARAGRLKLDLLALLFDGNRPMRAVETTETTLHRSFLRALRRARQHAAFLTRRRPALALAFGGLGLAVSCGCLFVAANYFGRATVPAQLLGATYGWILGAASFIGIQLAIFGILEDRRQGIRQERLEATLETTSSTTYRIPSSSDSRP